MKAVHLDLPQCTNRGAIQDVQYCCTTNLRQRLVDHLARRLREADCHLGQLFDGKLRRVSDVHRPDLPHRGEKERHRNKTKSLRQSPTRPQHTVPGCHSGGYHRELLYTHSVTAAPVRFTENGNNNPWVSHILRSMQSLLKMAPNSTPRSSCRRGRLRTSSQNHK